MTNELHLPYISSTLQLSQFLKLTLADLTKASCIQIKLNNLRLQLSTINSFHKPEPNPSKTKRESDTNRVSNDQSMQDNQSQRAYSKNAFTRQLIYSTVAFGTEITAITFTGEEPPSENEPSFCISMNTRSCSISRRLGPSMGWRSKRVRIAMALRKQGWTYQSISEHLFASPKSIMRDIKCYVINPRRLARETPTT